MKVVGIVVEYNPLHHGHVHHINETKRLSQADVLIAVMSGNVVQRGEFSMFDKFTKTKWALDAGVDLVVELPGVFSLQSADLFAETSIRILDLLGCEALYFGSESGKIDPLIETAKIMRSGAFHTSVKHNLSLGHSYPTSADLALKSITSSPLHKTPNNILGLQYIQAIHRIKSSMKPYAIKRIETSYYDDIKDHTHIQSATAIRKGLLKGQSVSTFVPSYVLESLHPPFVTLEDFRMVFEYLFKGQSAETLEGIFGMEEGLENRFLKVKHFSSVQAMVEDMITSRYTYAKIKRAMMHALIGIKKEILTDFSIPYVRILGMNRQGQAHLNKVKGSLEDLGIPLITKLSKARHPYLDLELRIAKLYSMIAGEDIFLKEFKPVRIV